MKLIEIFNRKIVYAIFIILMIINSNIHSYKFFNRNQKQAVHDNSSIYTADDAVSLLSNIAKKLCVKATSATTTAADFDNIIVDCLNNLRNEAVTFENNLKTFWNTCCDYVKNKSDANKKKIDQNSIESIMSLVKNHRVKISKHHGSSCNNMVVLGNFDQAAVIGEIERYLSKFKLDNKPQGAMISSAIGVHRNMADPSFFSKLNGVEPSKGTTIPQANKSPAPASPAAKSK